MARRYHYETDQKDCYTGLQAVDMALIHDLMIDTKLISLGLMLICLLFLHHMSRVPCRSEPLPDTDKP